MFPSWPECRSPPGHTRSVCGRPFPLPHRSGGRVGEGILRPNSISSEGRSHGAVGGHTPRPLRDPGSSWSRGDGRGLPRARHAPRARRRDQGPPARPPGRRGAAPALRARGPHRFPAQPPAHLHPPRRRPGGRSALPGDGAPGGGVARRAAAEGPASAVRGPSIWQRGRRGPARGAQAGDHPPGPEAGQRGPDEVWGEAPGLRARQGGGGSITDRGPEPCAHRGPAAHGEGLDPGDLPVHGAGAARGARGRRADRHLRPRGAALRDGDRATGLPGRIEDEPHRRHRVVAAGTGLDGGAGEPRGPRPRHSEVSREGPGRALAVGPGRGDRAALGRRGGRPRRRGHRCLRPRPDPRIGLATPGCRTRRRDRGSCGVASRGQRSGRAGRRASASPLRHRARRHGRRGAEALDGRAESRLRSRGLPLGP